MFEAPGSPKPKWLEFYDLAMAHGAFDRAPSTAANTAKGDAALTFAVIALPVTAVACLEPILRL